MIEKKIHYKLHSKISTVCGASVPWGFVGRDARRANVEHTFEQDKVTCKKCLAYITKQNRRYKCPLCGEFTDKMYVTESLIQKTVISASKRYTRKGGFEQRKLISVKCPECSGEIPTGDRDWRDLADDLLFKDV